MGCMYGVPADPDWTSKVFSVLFFTWGLVIVAGALGDFIYFFAGHFNSIVDVQRKRLLSTPDVLLDSIWVDLLTWKDHWRKYFSLLAVIFWLLVGIYL